MNFASVLFTGYLAVGFVLYPSIAIAEEPLTRAMNWTVLFFMAMPYTIGGSIGAWIVYTHWRTAKKRGELQRREPILRLVKHRRRVENE